MATTKSVLHASSVLLGMTEITESFPSKLRKKDLLSTILLRRLAAFRSIATSASWPTEACLECGIDEQTSEAYLKEVTADSAAFALTLISFDIDDNQERPSASTSTASAIPIFGSTDVKIMSTLSSVVGRWGLSARVLDGIIPAALGDIASSKMAGKVSESKFTEIIEVLEKDGGNESRETKLTSLVQRMLKVVILGQGVRKDSGAGQLSMVVLPQLILPLLAALIQLVYKDEVASWAKFALDDILTKNSTVAIISHLLMLLSSASNQNVWLRPALSILLTEQLVAVGGIRSLLIVVVGNDDTLNTHKLSMLSRLVRAGVKGSAKSIYLKNVVEQLLDIVQRASDSAMPPSSLYRGKSIDRPLPPPPVSITQAACFVLSELIDRYTEDMESALYPRLHCSFLPERYTSPASVYYEAADPEALDPVIISSYQLFRSLFLLSTIILHAPPSPHLLPFLLGLITSTLFSLTSYLLTSKADPVMLEEIATILETWGKAASLEAASRGVIRAVEDIEMGMEFGSTTLDERPDQVYWARSDNGSVCIRRKIQLIGSSPEDPTKLKLDPEAMLVWLAGVSRKDLSSAVFVRWLDEVQALRKMKGFKAAKKSVLRLQLVVKMVDQFGAELLSQPNQIIAFVAHALDADDHSSTEKPGRDQNVDRQGLNLSDLKLVDEIHGEPHEDDEETLLPGSGVDEITMTAVTLLLAVLEANENISISNTPILSLIYDRLDLLVEENSEIVSPLARDARSIISLRQASDLAPIQLSASPDPLSASRDRYQEALKLLQDPILPVRAQGLSILRSLIASREALLSTDPALLPAVLDIFIQAIEDEDSFLYLNAVEGLSCMVDVYGKQIVTRLVEVYLGGRKKAAENVGKGERGRRELDKRLKIGETLVRVVQRAGEAFAMFVDDLLPSLLLILRTSTLPVPLRSSTLTILATAVETAPIAMLQYADTLTEACITLLSLESRPLQPRRPTTTASKLPSAGPEDSDEEDNTDDNNAPQLDRHGQLKRPEETPDPVATNSKHPVLRRAAILFLGLIFRSAAILNERESDQNNRGLSYDSHNPLSSFDITGRPRGRGNPSRALVSIGDLSRARTVLRYVGETDQDSLVRHQAKQVLLEIEAGA